MNKFVISAALAATVLAAGAGGAKPVEFEGDTYRVSIPYGDLNLSNPRGAAAFANRVDHAADRVCGGSKVVPLDQAQAINECRTQLVGKAFQNLQLALGLQEGAAGASH